MAVALVGIPKDLETSERIRSWYRSEQEQEEEALSSLKLALPNHLDKPSHSLYSTPSFSSVELDDAIIHFRCGDLMQSTHPHYGFVKFHCLADPLPYNVKSIGISTQPFADAAQHRM